MEKKIIAAIRRQGYKITPSRRLIVQTIVQSREPLTPSEVYAKVKLTDPGISPVTVYRTLELLMKLGFICEIHGARNCGSYVANCLVEHHHHLTCSRCGQVTDFTGCDLNSLEDKLGRKTGFEIESHILEFVGLCSNCQKCATQ